MERLKTFKKLKNIVPFNKFLFRSCYYHQLISAYARYGIDERLLIMNYVPLYDNCNLQNHFDYIDIFTEKELENLSGIRLIKKRYVENIINRLISSINQGMPVLIGVDCFYLSYREDTYKKQHVIHFILVYGYDKKARKFIINEHSYLNSFLYFEREVDFQTIKTAYNACKTKLGKEKTDCMTKVKKIASKRYEFSPSHYVNAYYKNKERIGESLNNLTNYCEYIFSILPDKERLDKVLKKIVDDFGFIRFKKNVQRYQMAILFNDESINKLNYRCVDNLIFIYGVLAKIYHANYYSERSVEKLINRLNEFKETEQNIHKIWIEKYEEKFY